MRFLAAPLGKYLSLPVSLWWDLALISAPSKPAEQNTGIKIAAVRRANMQLTAK